MELHRIYSDIILAIFSKEGGEPISSLSIILVYRLDTANLHSQHDVTAIITLTKILFANQTASLAEAVSLITIPQIFVKWGNSIKGERTRKITWSSI